MPLGIVKTQYGYVKGKEITQGKYAGVSWYKSIPYAAPPVGDLRWRPPQDAVCWEGVRDCAEFPCRPMQVGGKEVWPHEPWTGDFHFEPYPDMSEDCLYLSVATDARDAGERRPVFVWFHGGGLSRGYYFEVEFDPCELAKKGIVVVSVGSRLNIFGYFSLPQLSAEQGGLSGNYGLMDTVKALKWVHDNIAAFGGDPGCITVGGQSGGTSKSGALVCSPASKRYIRRMINQSSLNWLIRHPTVAEYERQCVEFLRNIGIDPDTPAGELRKIPAGRFFEGVMERRVRMPTTMVCDGYYVPETDQRVSMDRYGGAIDVLSGCNYGEATMRPGMFLGGAPYCSAEEVDGRAREMLGELYDKYGFAGIAGITEENFDNRSRYLAAMGMSFRGGIMTSRIFGRYRAEKFPGARTWTYLFAQVPPSRAEEAGTARDQEKLLSWHSAELWYTFASLRDGVPPARPWRSEDFATAGLISDYWANFIKTGDPNGKGLPVWPICGKGMDWMELSSKPKAHIGIENRLDEMIHAYVEREWETMMWEME